MSFGELSAQRSVLAAKCRCGEMSGGEMSGDKMSGGEMSGEEMSGHPKTICEDIVVPYAFHSVRLIDDVYDSG